MYGRRVTCLFREFPFYNSYGSCGWACLIRRDFSGCSMECVFRGITRDPLLGFPCIWDYTAWLFRVRLGL